MRLATLPLVILAAGKSSRMGFPKGLMLHHGKKLLQYQIENYFKLGGKKVIVVLGEHRERYLNEIPALKNCEILFNDQVEWGPFYSLQLALNHLQETKACFLLPMDTPAACPSVWRNLAREHRLEHFITKPIFKDKGGHPIILGQDFFKKLLAVNPQSEEARLDLQIQKIDKKLIHVVAVCDTNIHLNINSL